MPSDMSSPFLLKMKNSRYFGPAMGFAILAALSVLIWWRPLGDTFALAWTNESYTHIILIFPLSAALIYTDSKRLRLAPRPSLLPGAALMTVALAIGCYAKWGIAVATSDVRLSLAMFAFVTWWIASVILCFGTTTFRRFLLPLCFLFLLIPIPVFALNWIVEFLQQQSASAARIMFRAIRVPVTQDGIMLSIPGLDIEVARECSSIRSSLMLIVTTTVLAHLFLRSWWRKALLIGATIPLSVAKNGLRIVTIAELGTRVDPKFITGRFHQNGGIIFFAIAVVIVSALLWLLWRQELAEASG